MKKALLVLIICLVSTSLALAQERAVTGTVTGPDGSAIAGITIHVKGTSIGTATGASGHYQVAVAEDGTLSLRDVGFAARESHVSGESSIGITMPASTQSLNELIVTARTNKINLTLVGPGQWGGGQFTDYNRYLNETNVDLMLNGQGNLSDDFSLNNTLSIHYKNHRFKSMFLGANQLTVPDFTILAI